jgi:hypothetical protein
MLVEEVDQVIALQSQSIVEKVEMVVVEQVLVTLLMLQRQEQLILVVVVELVRLMVLRIHKVQLVVVE